MIRYIRAFFIALKMTLRGETPPPPAPTYPRLQEWIQSTLQNVLDVYKAAELNGLSVAARQSHTIHIEGREISMETILGAVRYHLKEEYPHLLRHHDQHSITAIYATNMNDQYHVAKLLESVENKAVKPALARLGEQLNAIPPSNEI